MVAEKSDPVLKISLFDAYLQICPASAGRGKATKRVQCITWSDAAGATKWVAAILSVEGQYFWTHMQTPDFCMGPASGQRGLPDWVSGIAWPDVSLGYLSVRAGGGFVGRFLLIMMGCCMLS